MTEIQFNPKIKAEHLARKAIVYLRQSSDKQVVVRKNSIRLSSDRDAGSYLFGFPTLGNPRNQLSWRKILLSRTDPVPS
jgi:hypothetical protein